MLYTHVQLEGLCQCVIQLVQFILNLETDFLWLFWWTVPRTLVVIRFQDFVNDLEDRDTEEQECNWIIIIQKRYDILIDASPVVF